MDKAAPVKHSQTATLLAGLVLGLLVLVCLCDGRGVGVWRIHTHFPWCRDHAVGVEFEKVGGTARWALGLEGYGQPGREAHRIL